MSYSSSIIIRTKNEGQIFHQVLSKLKQQTNQNFEIIVVDDNSTDGTDKLAYQYFPKSRVKLVTVPQGKFSHPYSCNLGAEAAAGKYLVYINGHAVPKTKRWLADGLASFTGENVAGVFASVLAQSNTTIWEKIFYNSAFLIYNRKIIYKQGRMGILGTTNAIIPKRLWLKHHFNEDYRRGGEDGEWANYFFQHGYVIINDPNFTVYHSHGLSLLGMLKQILSWFKMSKPSPDSNPTRASDY